MTLPAPSPSMHTAPANWADENWRVLYCYFVINWAAMFKMAREPIKDETIGALISIVQHQKLPKENFTL